MDKLLKVLTDPVSNKLLQTIRVRKQLTISEIIAENTGIPRATIYRKIDKMLAVGAICVVDTHKVRGQIEHVYAIKDIYISNLESKEENMKTVTMSLMQILDSYDRYFESEHADVNRDKLFMLNYCISLDDGEFSNMMKDIIKVVDRYQHKQCAENAKLRNLYLLSAPGGDKNE
ncbi:MAG: hypothetical protein IJ040_01785 [Lachnospiraceae bacterium]|nr:hypothetical protein [Lachnospiraceae bacterium]